MDKSKIDLDLKNSTFNISRIYNIITGLWPYLTKKDRFVKLFFNLSIMILALEPEIKGIIKTCGNDLGICVENMTTSIYYSAVIFKCSLPIISLAKFEALYEALVDYWSAITDFKEKQIIAEYSKSGKFRSLIYTGAVIYGGVFFSQVPMIPPLLDYVLPLNESRQKFLLAEGSYPFDPFQYFYELHAFMSVVAYVNISLILANDTTFIVIIHQCLGAFEITKHRLEEASKQKNQEAAHHIVVSAVRNHQQALEIFKLIQLIYEKIYLVLIGFSIVTITLCGVLILERSDNLVNMGRTCLFVAGIVFHLFYISWQGQLMIDQTQDLFFSTYFTRWYQMLPKTKKIIHIMMMRCKKPCILSAAGLYTMDFENFGLIIKSATSYMTVAINLRA